jgi:glycosyltransferase involved in cell wall biosynthesis
MPLRVLHLYAGNLYGGIERMLATLARERCACPEMEPHFGLCFEGRLSRELRESGAIVHPLGIVRFSRPWSVRAARQRLRAIFREQRFDVAICHSTWSHAVFAPAVRAEGATLIQWVHDVPTGKPMIERLSARTPPDLFLANSEYTGGFVRKLHPNTPCQVQYPPVSMPQVDCDSARRDVRRQLNCPDDAFVIACTSRLDRWKGHAVLIEALGRMNITTPWRCWIAGGVQRPQEHRYLEELRSQAHRLRIESNVAFLGEHDDIDSLLAAADVLCQANISPEPFGITFVEAMYAGLPVVTSNMGGAAEIVDDSCGVLPQSGDADAVAEALHRLAGNEQLRRMLGEHGRQRAAELGDPSRALAQLHDRLAGLARRTTAVALVGAGA